MLNGSRAFDGAHFPPRGRQLVTLKTAAQTHIRKFPAEADLEEMAGRGRKRRLW